MDTINGLEGAMSYRRLAAGKAVGKIESARWIIERGTDRRPGHHCKVPSRLKPPVYDLDDVSTASRPVDMREQVTLLNRKLTQQQRNTDRRFRLCTSSMLLRLYAYRALLIPSQRSSIGGRAPRLNRL
ncbi:hypothetical protein PIB30_081852 [Stylosanthes scabra]|uniref:Uncharacterized protein n=1 Tax=Stylosanthes scabra TaxID=79078 RepID=A0ABU6YQN1_9FABA|nr:hypothetical protein [Stylosanthes scabra]